MTLMESALVQIFKLRKLSVSYTAIYPKEIEEHPDIFFIVLKSTNMKSILSFVCIEGVTIKFDV